jgi:hypothetical protein
MASSGDQQVFALTLEEVFFNSGASSEDFSIPLFRHFLFCKIEPGPGRLFID